MAFTRQQGQVIVVGDVVIRVMGFDTSRSRPRVTLRVDCPPGTPIRLTEPLEQLKTHAAVETLARERRSG